ncbi:DUF4227 family protein [Camelliibacillus cellulosilyticus]|uniref:DUF4227 family protein n=1 Tax=Camelliibacillus cellulosilyticus TaxID=2174486 RepID=UPI00366B3E19
MKTTLKIIFDTMKVFVLFVICTVLFYFGLEWLDHNYESYHKFDKPNDGAIKVFGESGHGGDSTDIDPLPGRFFQFLRDGE